MRSGSPARTGLPSCLPTTWGSRLGLRSRRKRCVSAYMPMAMCVSVPPGHSSAKPKSNLLTWETRGSVEVLLAGAAAPESLPIHDLVEVDLWDQLPANLPALLAHLPQADLYLQDEVQFAFHPTLPRFCTHKGRRPQRFVEAPTAN